MAIRQIGCIFISNVDYFFANLHPSILYLWSCENENQPFVTILFPLFIYLMASKNKMIFCKFLLKKNAKVLKIA